MVLYRKLIFSFFTVITLLSFGCSDSETTSVRLQDDPSSQGTVTVFDTDDELLDVRRRPDEEIISPGGNQQGGAGTQNPGSGRNQGGNGSGAGSGGGNSGGTVLPLEIRTSSPLREQKYDVELPQTLQVAGGVAPYSWSIGGLPSGLFHEDLQVGNSTPIPCPREASEEICDQEGYVLLKGSAKEIGTFALQVKVRDAQGTEVSKEFQLLVDEDISLQVSKGEGTFYRADQHQGRSFTYTERVTKEEVTLLPEEGDLIDFQTTGEFSDSEQLVQLNRKEIIKLEFTGAASSYTWDFGSVTGVTKIKTPKKELGRGESLRNSDVSSTVESFSRRVQVHTESIYVRIDPSRHGGVIQLPLKITDNLGTEHPFPLQLQLDDECQRAGPPLISFTEEDQGPRVIIDQEVTNEPVEILHGVAPFSVRFVESTLTLQGSEECTQHGHRMTAIMRRPWQTHTTPDERKFTISGHFRFDVPLGPGSEACSLIMEQVRYEVTDVCGRTQRMRRRYIIDYPSEDTIVMSLVFKAWDTDVTESIMKYRLTNESHNASQYASNAERRVIGYSGQNDFFRNEEHIQLEQYGDGGTCDYDDNNCWYTVTKTLSAATEQPFSSVADAYIHITPGCDETLGFCEYLNFKIRSAHLESRYWYADFSPNVPVEVEYSDSFPFLPKSLHFWTGIEWKRKSSP